MLSSLTTAQKTQLNQMSRNFSYGASNATGWSQFISDLLAYITSGEIGIQSNAYDVDSLALGGGAFSFDADTTTGLTFGYFQGQFYDGPALVSVAAGTINLTASATNYIEVDGSGVVHTNTVAFTAGRLPLYVVITGSASITSWANAKTLLTFIGNNTITGLQLSTAAATKSVSKGLGTLTGTESYLVRSPVAGNLSGMSIVCPTGVATGAAYWSVSATNLGAAGVGAQAMLAATAVNSTNTTGGSAVTAYVPFALTLSGTVGVNAGDVILVTFTATGSPPALTGSELTATFTFTD
jgi:hypothetical protein